MPSSHLNIVLLDYRDITHPLAGGAEAYLNECFQRVAAHGHRVTLICGGYAGAPAEDRVGRLRILRLGHWATLNFTAPRAALRLARQERVDLFVENICKLPFFMPVLTRIPVLAIVLHLLGWTVFYETNPAFASYVWLYERLIPRLYRDRPFVTISNSTAGDLKRRGLRASRMEVVNPGLNLAAYHAADEIPKASEPLLVYLGMLKRYKGIDTVIRSFARVRRQLPEARLVLAGKGSDRPRLESLTRSLGLAEAITFPGYVSDEEKIRWLRRAHAVVYPSRKEGWGIPAMEAAACATPAVASATDGLRDAVQDGITGYLVPHNDVEAWAARMIEVLTDDSTRSRLGRAARQRADRFGWDVQAEKMRVIVEEVANNRPRAPS